MKSSEIMTIAAVACLVRNVLAEFNRWLGYLESLGYPKLTVAILKEF